MIELHIQPYIDILINQADQKCDLKNKFDQFVTFGWLGVIKYNIDKFSCQIMQFGTLLFLRVIILHRRAKNPNICLTISGN